MLGYDVIFVVFLALSSSKWLEDMQRGRSENGQARPWVEACTVLGAIRFVRALLSWLRY